MSHPLSAESPQEPPARGALLGGPNWLIPKPFALVSSLLYLGTLFLFFYERAMGLYNHPLQWEQAAAMVAATGGLLWLDRVEARRYGEWPPARVAAGILAARVGLIEIVAQLDDFSFSPFLYLLIPFTATLYFGMRGGGWAAVGVWLIYLVKISLYGVRWFSVQADIHSVLIFTVGLVFAVTMAGVVDRERRQRARMERLVAEQAAAHRQLQAYAAQVADLATVQERNRLARDIHDSLGHYLTAINVQLEKAQAFRAAHPAEADQAVTDARHLTREALSDVRRSVGALRRPDRPPGLADGLAALVADTRRDGLAVDLQIHGPADQCPPAVGNALYRATQEGLTNIRKHAGASAAGVALEIGPAMARLVVQDNGRGPAELPASGDHYGLQGLRERLEPLGGTLALTGAPGAGARLEVAIPCAVGAAPASDVAR